MEKEFIVYKITNKNNGKIYIGQTSYTLEHRWKRHISSTNQGSTLQFHKAIRKHGIYCWDKEILYKCGDYSEICEKEEFYIKKYKSFTFKYGYNSTMGGTGGWVVRPENYNKWHKNMCNSVKGYNNPRWNGLTDEDLIQIGLKYFNEMGVLPRMRELYRFDNRFPKSFSKNRFGGKYKNFIKILENKTGTTAKKYKPTKQHIENIRKSQYGKMWITNGYKNKQIKKEDFESFRIQGFYKGRINGNKN